MSILFSKELSDFQLTIFLVIWDKKLIILRDCISTPQGKYVSKLRIRVSLPSPQILVCHSPYQSVWPRTSTFWLLKHEISGRVFKGINSCPSTSPCPLSCTSALWCYLGGMFNALTDALRRQTFQAFQ